MSFVFLYVCLGFALAAGTMIVPILRGHMEAVAKRVGLSLGYARTLWVIGTIIAWPVGLYVLITGQLILPTRDHGADCGVPSTKSTSSLAAVHPAKRQAGS